MTYSTFCASPSCHLHGVQVDDTRGAFRCMVYDAPELARPLPGDRASFKYQEHRRVWFQTIGGSRFSLCEDCAAVGRADQWRELPAGVQAAVQAFYQVGKKPTRVALGHGEYHLALAEMYRGRDYYANAGEEAAREEFMGLEVVRLDSPSGLFVF